MRQLLFIIALVFSSSIIYSQTSCYELKQFVETKCSQTASYCCFDSEFLTDVKFYEYSEGYDTYYFAIVRIDFLNEYVYCVPSNAKSNFSYYAYGDQAGEAFHEYIHPYKCNCY